MGVRPAEPWRPSARLEAMWQRDVIGPMEDFQDPSQEWRRLFSELLGTFFLVLVAARRRDDGPGVPEHDQPHRPR